ncbi:MAG TPA: ferritin-like domain-containing protein [Steroidobacteraceae bacterium]|nr:ferritin-like domain-containing protein [Steroidobacteraceae bacterium]HRX90114.1 ferritin-like domain-containing protein [Steroidobacteraceae bacterium]
MARLGDSASFGIAPQIHGSRLALPEEELSRAQDVALLNEALESTLILALQCGQQRPVYESILEQLISAEFSVHASIQLEYADRIAERIVQLGGEPEFDLPQLAACSGCDDQQSPALAESMCQLLGTERAVIEALRTTVMSLSSVDGITRKMVCEIILSSEAHLNKMTNLLDDLQFTAKPSSLPSMMRPQALADHRTH